MKTVTQDSKNGILRQSQGAITIFQIIPLWAVVIGICGGVKFGSRFGLGGEWIGGLIGGVVGWFGWRFLLLVICRWLDRKRNFGNKTVEELRLMLRDPNCKVPNVVLLELGTRKQNVEEELPVVLDMLVSPLKQRRMNGWRTLASIFPERAKLVADYRIDDSVDKCREKIQRILPIQT